MATDNAMKFNGTLNNEKRKLNDFLPLWTLVSHFQSISPSVDGHKKHCGFLQFWEIVNRRFDCFPDNGQLYLTLKTFSGQDIFIFNIYTFLKNLFCPFILAKPFL